MKTIQTCLILLFTIFTLILMGCFGDDSTGPDNSPVITSPLFDSTVREDTLDVTTDFPMEVPFIEASGEAIEFELLNSIEGITSTTTKNEDTTFLKLALNQSKITLDSQYNLSIKVKVPAVNYSKDYSYSVVVIDTVIPDTFSVWHEITSGDSLKGTLLNHIPLNYNMVFGDKENKALELIFENTPKGFITKLDSSGDSLKLNVTWEKSEIELDKDLELKLTLKGTGSNDLIRLSYRFRVTDQASLLHVINGRDSLRSELVYDPDFSYRVAFSDSNNTPYSVFIDSLSSGFKHTVDTLSDSVVLKINYDKENLKFGDTLIVDIRAAGTGPEDTIKINHRVIVSDPKSVWSSIVSKDSLKDTILYREGLEVKIAGGDPHGFPVHVFNTDLPPGFHSSMDTTGDTLNLKITVEDTLMKTDSAYSFTVEYRGSGPEDTVKHDFSFYLQDNHSIIKNLLTTDTLGDTLLYGDSVVLSFSFRDTSSQDLPEVNILNIADSSKGVVVKQGDSTTVTLTLKGEEYQYDTTHTIQVRVKGQGSADTTNLDFTFFAKDSSRLGGLKKMVKGVWWKQIQYDTVTIFEDSAGVKSDSSMTLVHELVTQVAAVRKVEDTLYYTFYNSDSILELDSVEQNITFIKHTPTYAEMIFPVADFFLDSLTQKVFDLPIQKGAKWDISSNSFDTNFTVDIDSTTKLPLKISAVLGGNSEITDLTEYTTKGETYPCVRMTNIIDNNFTMFYDSILINPADSTDTLLTVGDSLSSAISHAEGDQCFSMDYLGVFWEHTLEAVTETDVFKKKKTVTNSRTTKFLEEYFDPRIGTSIKFRDP